MSFSVDNLEKIFIPIIEANDHWFLLIIWLSEEKLLYLDSDWTTASQSGRRDLVMRMASYIYFVIVIVAVLVCAFDLVTNILT